MSIYLLILANLVPFLGSLFLGWNLFSIIFIFWAENLVVGFYNIFRILKADKDKVSIGVKIGSAIFFTFHYGMFTLVHGVFVFVLFGKTLGGLNSFLGILTSVAFLFISHGYSYFSNYIGKEEYKKVSFGEVMMAPYGRIIVLHLTIIFGGFFIILLSAPQIVVSLLVLIKIFVDISAHKKEHLILSLDKNEKKSLLKSYKTIWKKPLKK